MGASRAPRGPTEICWTSQPGPHYSPRGSQDQPEKMGLSAPSSPGWLREKNGEAGVKSAWSSGCIALSWQRSWVVSSHRIFPRRPHAGSSGSPLSEHTHVPQFSVRESPGAPPPTGHAPPHTIPPPSSPQQRVPTTRPTNQGHTSTNHTTNANVSTQIEFQCFTV